MAVLVLLGVGTADSARFAPAGLLVEYGHARVGLDGGPGSEPPENVDAWLVRDDAGLDSGEQPPYEEWGDEGRKYRM